MSTRYVWDKFQRDSHTGTRTSYRAVGKSQSSFTFYIDRGQQFQIGSSFSISPYNGSFSLSGVTTHTVENGVDYGGGYIKSSSGEVVYGPSWSERGVVQYLIKTDNATVYTAEPYQESYTYYTKGSKIGLVSAGKAGQYPDDNYSGSYWYVKAGQDNIDPAAVALPGEIAGGQTVTITVTPSQGKKYGGTVSYEYQYKLDGGAWTALAVSSAATQQLTVPKGTQTVAARALAKDDLGFVSSTWVESAPVPVTNNQAPTAPGSIQVENAIRGQTASITITAATDPDGTVARYVYERSVDAGRFQPFAEADSLTQTDLIQEDWGTVAYRAAAVDNEGAQGPFVTSGTFTINSGLLMIGGPVSNLGIRPGPFSLALTIGVSGQTGVTDIQLTVRMDSSSLYSGLVQQGTVVTLPIDTRTMGSGPHEIYAVLTKPDYEAASAFYVFTVPSTILPAGGYAQQLQDASGQPIYPQTSARYVIGEGGKSVQTQLNELRSAHLGRTGHLDLADAILGPVSGLQLPRTTDAVYAAVFFHLPGGSGGKTLSIPASYNGDAGDSSGKITAAPEGLTVTLPANAILALYQYVHDAPPPAQPDISVQFLALAQPKVTSAGTNNAAAADSLTAALQQIAAAYPSYNKYALTDAAGAVTYYVASPGRIQPSTKTAVVAYVASDRPTTWYSNTAMTFEEESV